MAPKRKIAEDLESMTVAQLRTLARKNNTRVSGTKADVIAGLRLGSPAGKSPKSKRARAGTFKDAVQPHSRIETFLERRCKAYDIPLPAVSSAMSSAAAGDDAVVVRMFGEASEVCSASSLRIPMRNRDTVALISLRLCRRLNVEMLDFSLFKEDGTFLNPRHTLASEHISCGDTVVLVPNEDQPTFTSTLNKRKAYDALSQHPAGYWSCAVM